VDSPTRDCPREDDVLEAIARDRLAGVEDHLASCAICADLAAVARALRDDHAAACREAQPPSAAIVWWRATIRARAEAARTVSQPITILQGVAAACGIGLACGTATLVWPSLRAFAAGVDLVARLDARRDDLAAVSTLAAHYSLPLLLAVAACLVIAPFAVYLALNDE